MAVQGGDRIGSVTSPSLGQTVATLHARFDPTTAQDWDRVGLVCGDPAASVALIHFAVDPTDAVVDEALLAGADLLVTHHPLLLRGVHSVAADSAKGGRIHRLITGGCGLLAIHTNADAARPGVSDALANALGLQETRPLEPIPDHNLDKLVVHVPESHTEQLLGALFAAGAGRVAGYDSAAYTTASRGQFRHTAQTGDAESTSGLQRSVEKRIELVLPRSRRNLVLQALLDNHPYEQPAYDLVAIHQAPGSRGIGRVGTLASPTDLATFTEAVAAVLPPAVAGVKAAGPLDATISTVAVSGGSGDSLLTAANRAGADVFVTSDLRHHPVDEHLATGGCPVIDISHAAGEALWLPAAADQLRHDLLALGYAVQTEVSRLVTDPWTLHVRSAPSKPH